MGELILVTRVYPCDLATLRAGGSIYSTDNPHYDVAGFLAAHGLPQPVAFVSVACYTNAAPARCYARLYGPVELRLNTATVIHDLGLAAHDDVQDAAASGRPERFLDLAAVPAPEPRASRLHDFVAAYYAKRPAAKYVEARLSRPLTSADVAAVDESAIDAFGFWQQNWDAHTSCPGCAADGERRAAECPPA
jgi:hypothetical protein